ncbi:MAG TPA: TVP38/TMEM64 family protein [Balneolaceae bacterium]
MTKNDEVHQSKSTFIATAILIAGLVGAYFLIPSYRSFLQEAFAVLTSGNDDRISQWVLQFGFWGPFFIVLTTVAQMFLLIINSVLMILVAILAYGPFWGSLLAILSICTASTIGYFVGRFLGARTIAKLIGEKSKEKVEEFMNRYGVGAVIIFRFAPFLSDDAISFVAGLLTMNYWKFMIATIAGVTPLTMLIAWMAEDMERLTTGLIWVSAISLAGFIAYVVYDKYWRK